MAYSIGMSFGVRSNYTRNSIRPLTRSRYVGCMFRSATLLRTLVNCDPLKSRSAMDGWTAVLLGVIPALTSLYSKDGDRGLDDSGVSHEASTLHS